MSARRSIAASARAQLPHAAFTPRLHLTYAIAPPNRTTAVDRRRAIASAQSVRVSSLPIDALLVYDLQDETVRNRAPRPFPFVPKVDPLTYALDELYVGALPRIVYCAVAEQSEQSLQRWVSRLRVAGGSAIFVGAPSRNACPTMTLPQAYALCRSRAPTLGFGGVLIAERHRRSRDEDARVCSKLRQGCAFFVSQTMWSVCDTKQLLSDLRDRAARAGCEVPPVLLTLSACGSEQTLWLQEWLGVYVPTPVKRDLIGAKDMLSRSVELAVEAFAEVRAFAQALGIAVGCNVESVTARPAEVEASMELTRRIARIQGRSETIGCAAVESSGGVKGQLGGLSMDHNTKTTNASSTD